MSRSPIIDSQFDTNEVILQNPDEPCPREILDDLGVLSVHYKGFGGELHQGQIVIAVDVISEVREFFKQALERDFPIERVVPVSAPPYRWDGKKVLADNLSSGFDYRKVKTQDKVSMHGLGRAFDINPQQNPYTRYKGQREILHVPTDAEYDKSQPGTLHAGHPLVLLMEGYGWTWGGSWKPVSGRVDYMHFEKPV